MKVSEAQSNQLIFQKTGAFKRQGCADLLTPGMNMVE